MGRHVCSSILELLHEKFHFHGLLANLRKRARKMDDFDCALIHNERYDVPRVGVILDQRIIRV